MRNNVCMDCGNKWVDHDFLVPTPCALKKCEAKLGESIGQKTGEMKMTDTRNKFEAFIAEYASKGAFDLTPCPEFPEQYDDLETQMLYDAFMEGAAQDQPLLIKEARRTIASMAARIAELEAHIAELEAQRLDNLDLIEKLGNAPV
jgi:hypothetical protein